MKEKRWIFFRVMVYLCITGAGLGLFTLLYYTTTEFRSIRSLETIVILFFTTLIIQIVFNTLNIRLIHHHLHQKVLPEKTFRTWHTVLVVLNSCIAVAFICLFIFGLIETLKTISRRGHSDSGDITALLVIGAYTFVTIATVAGSLRLRSYIRKSIVFQEEEWLNQLGTS